MSDEDQNAVDFIYLRYKTMYGFPQGFCGQIAEEIQSKIGGELVAGYLAFSGHTREHWWVNIDGVVIDPMSDELQEKDQHRHVEVHRDLSKRYWVEQVFDETVFHHDNTLPF
jgi:hypothetical protein